VAKYEYGDKRTSTFISFDAREKLNKIVEVYQIESELRVTQFYTLNNIITEKYDSLVLEGKIKEEK